MYKDDTAQISWRQPEGPYTSMSMYQCAGSKCTEHIVRKPHDTTVLTLNIDTDTHYEFYAVLHQNTIEVLRTDKFYCGKEESGRI